MLQAGDADGSASCAGRSSLLLYTRGRQPRGEGPYNHVAWAKTAMDHHRQHHHHHHHRRRRRRRRRCHHHRRHSLFFLASSIIFRSLHCQHFSISSYPHTPYSACPQPCKKFINFSVGISRTKQQRGTKTAATTPGPAACGEALQCKAEGISGDGDRRPANIIAPS